MAVCGEGGGERPSEKTCPTGDDDFHQDQSSAACLKDNQGVCDA